MHRVTPICGSGRPSCALFGEVCANASYYRLSRTMPPKRSCSQTEVAIVPDDIYVRLTGLDNSLMDRLERLRDVFKTEHNR